MKTILKLAAGILLFLGGLTLFSNYAPDEIAQIIDQMNPFVPTTDMYVKTTHPESVNSYGTAFYKQTAADEKGKTRKIQFTGISQLKLDHYLKLTTKGQHVETYEEVNKDSVPKKALQQIENT